jgi:Zn-finger nucleic acid-binding protein
MQEIAKTGVLIDRCSTCKGVWLDRGELEKILSRAREIERDWEEEYRRPEPRRREFDDSHDPWSSSDRRQYKKKRWTDLFDIFD